jgi:Resolvase, N terminal domain
VPGISFAAAFATIVTPFTLIEGAAVSDRLGRSLQHLVELLNELQALHCNLYLHQQAIDTTTPSGKAMFQMCGACCDQTGIGLTACRPSIYAVA